jgi:hypothetical protein
VTDLTDAESEECERLNRAYGPQFTRLLAEVKRRRAEASDDSSTTIRRAIAADRKRRG